MRNKTRRSALVVLLMAALTLVAAAVTEPSSASSIDGDWIVSFTIRGNQTIPGHMTLRTAGKELTGTVETEHTGPGTLDHGTWTTSQISATCVFKTHENIEITGQLKDGSLSGTFRTEGTQGTWRAVRTGRPGAQAPPQ